MKSVCSPETLRMLAENSMLFVDKDVRASIVNVIDEYERIRKGIEQIAFGRVEGDYSDVRYFARQLLEAEETDEDDEYK